LYSYEEAYLVTLSSLEVVVASGQPEFLGWSGDGRYLVFNRTAESDEGGLVSMLMTSGGESRQLADPAGERVSWNPSEPFGGLYSGDGSELLFFDAVSGRTRQLDFEGTILDAVWEPGGMGIILLSEEGRLLWLEDVFDAGRSPEPVTPPLSGIHSVRWSPDGGRLAFVSENVLYVVTFTQETCPSIEYLDSGTPLIRDILIELRDEIITSQSIDVQPGYPFELIPEGNILQEDNYLLLQTSFTGYLEPAIIFIRTVKSNLLADWEVVWSGQAEGQDLIRGELQGQYPGIPQSLIQCLEISSLFLQE
jgi:hypothetical protein